MGGGKSPTVSQPVVVSAAAAQQKARQSMLSARERQGLQSTILSQEQASSTGNVGYKTLLGGQ